MADVMSEAIELAGRAKDGIHVSFDMDVLDPTEVPGVGTPVPGGISYREAHLAMELIHASRKMVSLDLVEVNPILDTNNLTASIAVELIGSSWATSSSNCYHQPTRCHQPQDATHLLLTVTESLVRGGLSTRWG